MNTNDPEHTMLFPWVVGVHLVLWLAAIACLIYFFDEIGGIVMTCVSILLAAVAPAAKDCYMLFVGRKKLQAHIVREDQRINRILIGRE
jgi:hypothetical protein